MALFESGPKKILKKIRKYADEGSVNKVSSTVKEEKNVLLEESSVALELVELLLDIGHPNLAAGIGEEVMRRHRQVARDVRNIFIGRLNEYSRSTELLRVTWNSFMDMHDFRGALGVLRQAEEITVNNLFDMIREKMQSSMRFDGTVHPEADQSSLVEWALYLYRERRSGEAIDFLWKVAREVEFPHRDISIAAFWIGNEVKGLDSMYLISLMGIAAVFGKMDQALQYASKISDSEPTQDEATDAAAVIEKYMVPVDRSGRSAAILAEMYTAAGKTEAASRTLENIYSESLDREELETAIEDLVAHPESGAAPLILSAQMNVEKNRIKEASAAVLKAFEAGDADSGKLIAVCREIIEKTGDRTGEISVKLAEYLVSIGKSTDAVFALIPILPADPGWVLEQIQLLLTKDRNNPSILSLLAAVLYETGKKEKAQATLDLLQKRKDKQFCSGAAAVLDELDETVEKYLPLREARALFRYRSEREEDASKDWFKVLLAGVTPCREGQELLVKESIQAGSVAELSDADFRPATPWQASVAAQICLREKDISSADAFISQAMEDPDLQSGILIRLERLPDETLEQLDLRRILSAVSRGDAARSASTILTRIRGEEDWKVSLATSLKWDNPGEEARFKLEYLLSRGRVMLAGSSYVKESIGEPLLDSVGEACSLAVNDDFKKALELLDKPVNRPWSSGMARKVLEYILEKSPALNTEIRKLIARSLVAENSCDDVSHVLAPVIDDPGVAGLLEEMVEANPGEYSLVDSLVRASALQGNFENFHRYSAVLLELDGEASGDVASLARELAEKGESGEAWLYAARISSRSGLEADIDELIRKAVMLEPDLALDGLFKEFSGMDPATQALCSLAECNAARFSEVLGENPGLELPLNRLLLSATLEKWSPSGHAEAIYLLADRALKSEHRDIAEDMLVDLCSSGPEPWMTRASKLLLIECEEGRMDRKRFWMSVHVAPIISQALQRILPNDLEELQRDELDLVAPAVLTSGQGLERLFQLAQDPVLFPGDNLPLRRELAEKCLKTFRNTPEGVKRTEEDAKKLVAVLLSAGLVQEAVTVAGENPAGAVLGQLRRDLPRARKLSAGGELEMARALLLSGENDQALEILENIDESPEASGTIGHALWNAGFRQRAIEVWMREYRNTEDDRVLARIFWALDQAGAVLEASALRRYISGRNPGIAARLPSAGSGHDPQDLETISGLKFPVRTEKV